jgi:hypothetical protein
VAGNFGYKFINSYSGDALMAVVVIPFDVGGPEFKDYISVIYDSPCSADPNHDLTLVRMFDLFKAGKYVHLMSPDRNMFICLTY